MPDDERVTELTELCWAAYQIGSGTVPGLTLIYEEMEQRMRWIVNAIRQEERDSFVSKILSEDALSKTPDMTKGSVMVLLQEAGVL